MNLVIFLYWVGPAPFLELFWAGPVKKVTVYNATMLKGQHLKHEAKILFVGAYPHPQTSLLARKTITLPKKTCISQAFEVI